jgi:hypothetical protein
MTCGSAAPDVLVGDPGRLRNPHFGAEHDLTGRSRGAVQMTEESHLLFHDLGITLPSGSVLLTRGGCARNQSDVT